MLEYKVIEIYTSEEARWHGKQLSDALVEYVASLKIAARCIVTRGTDGCYEDGEIATRRLEVLSYNMPVRIYIILPAAECAALVSVLSVMVTDGIVAIHPLEVVSHRVKNRIIPRQIRVRDVMSTNPVTITPEATLDRVAGVLLSSKFTGLPVVNVDGRPVGIITQGDLIQKGGLPVRLGLLADSDQESKRVIMDGLSVKSASEIMSRPAIVIEESSFLTDAVELLIRKNIKRIPVVNSSGKNTGIVSRLDVFRTIMIEAPDWKSFAGQDVLVEDLRFVSDIMRRDTHEVSPGTPIEDVLRVIGTNDIQRVAVVDSEGVFLGLISDRDLLSRFAEEGEGVWQFLSRRIPFTEKNRLHRESQGALRARTASEIMNTEVPTVREDSTIDEAVELIVRREIKRLPVLDEAGRFKGMISRDSLLRTAFRKVEDQKS